MPFYYFKHKSLSRFFTIGVQAARLSAALTHFNAGKYIFVDQDLTGIFLK